MKTIFPAHAIRTVLLLTTAALACGASAPAQPFRLTQDDFPNVRFPDPRFGEPHLVVYDDGDLLASAAYRYSQRHHDSPWLVVTLGLAAAEALTVRREDIVLVRPDGLGVPPATERGRSRDPEGVRRFLNERADWPETLRFDFPRSRIDRGSYRFEFGHVDFSHFSFSPVKLETMYHLPAHPNRTRVSCRQATGA